MSDGTAIEWTDATWNPVTGCSVKSPGCKHCYAMLLAGTRLANHPSRAGLTQETKAGPVWTGEVRFNEQWLDQPLHWKRPRRIFVCAHGDLFHEDVPDEWIDRVFAVMALSQQHQFQVLTKRSDRMQRYMATLVAMDPDDRDKRFEGPAFDATQAPCVIGCLERLDWPLPNVWLGVSVEDQTRADERIPDLLATPAAIRFLSVEPLLGPVDLTRVRMQTSDILGFDALGGKEIHKDDGDLCTTGRRIDWVIVGGESGSDARPMDGDWARRLRDQCLRAGVPFFFKQWGEWIEVDCLSTEQREEAGDLSRLRGDPITGSVRLGKKLAGRMLDGAEHNGMPC